MIIIIDFFRYLMIPINYNLNSLSSSIANPSFISNRTGVIHNSRFCDCPYHNLKTDIKVLQKRFSFIVYLIIFKFFIL
jgi:hypothetical protein